MDLKKLRLEYSQAELSRATLAADPFNQFEQWFKEACNAGLWEPNAMILATVGPDLAPSQRTVLLKYFDQQGFIFFTNYASTKAVQIEGNSQVSLLFPWLRLERQCIISGRAERVSTLESAKYFATRPRESQLGAWISHQSSEIGSRALLLAKLHQATQRFSQGKIPLPDFWGGFRVRPTRFEFWQGRKARLHDRFQYRLKDGTGWTIHRLEP
jgi:pyridoxamine 5'-phosphate oxidase